MLILFKNIFIFGCTGSSLLSGLCSGCSEQGPLSSCGERTSRCSGFSCYRAQAVGAWASVVAACELGSCGPWAF